MVFCTEFMGGWWSLQPLRKSCIFSNYFMRKVHGQTTLKFPEILCERDAFRNLPVFKQFSVPQCRGSFHSSPSSHTPSDLKCLLFYVRPFPSAAPLAARHMKLVHTYVVPSLHIYELQDLLLIFDLITLTSLRVEYKLGWFSLSNFSSLLSLPLS